MAYSIRIISLLVVLVVVVSSLLISITTVDALNIVQSSHQRHQPPLSLQLLQPHQLQPTVSSSSSPRRTFLNDCLRTATTTSVFLTAITTTSCTKVNAAVVELNDLAMPTTVQLVQKDGDAVRT